MSGASAAFTFDRRETGSIPYATERSRGYEWQGKLWSPGYFRTDLGEGDWATLVASTESWETILRAHPRTGPPCRARAAANYCSPRPTPPPAPGRPRNWCWPPISS